MLRASGLSSIANSRSAYALGRRWQKASIFIFDSSEYRVRQHHRRPEEPVRKPVDSIQSQDRNDRKRSHEVFPHGGINYGKSPSIEPHRAERSIHADAPGAVS